ncbi:hypothetical protein IRJ41_025965 [Triplophysa rosa]|uniref:Uncharacterized protein n=1 Tax=Triplophysa rosa TaxID=992332 RepID=A0A9W7T721_TRIRA|nr:hypothetical protein IRJ41_025965 [Triplophysa rosa]
MCISRTFVKDVSANGARAKNTRHRDLQAENKKLNPLTSPLSLSKTRRCYHQARTTILALQAGFNRRASRPVTGTVTKKAKVTQNKMFGLRAPLNKA